MKRCTLMEVTAVSAFRRARPPTSPVLPSARLIPVLVFFFNEFISLFIQFIVCLFIYLFSQLFVCLLVL